MFLTNVKLLNLKSLKVNKIYLHITLVQGTCIRSLILEALASLWTELTYKNSIMEIIAKAIEGQRPSPNNSIHKKLMKTPMLQKAAEMAVARP